MLSTVTAGIWAPNLAMFWTHLMQLYDFCSANWMRSGRNRCDLVPIFASTGNTDSGCHDQSRSEPWDDFHDLVTDNDSFDESGHRRFCD